MKILLLIKSILKDFLRLILQLLSTTIMAILSATLILILPTIFLCITKELWVFVVVAICEGLIFDLINNKEHCEIVQYFRMKWGEINDSNK